ncbi:MAG: hypothetical protein R3F56_12480 [Planctomycetota bacterium]
MSDPCRFGRSVATRVVASIVPLLLASLPAAQAPFVNFEIPTVKGLTVVPLPLTTYVVVCNADDNSLTLVDAATGAVVQQRLAVGMGPVSAFWDASTNCLYTANFIGDSVSMVDIDPTQSPPARLRQTMNLQTIDNGILREADEPTDLVVRPGTNLLYVLLASTGRIATFDRTSLAPVPILPGATVSWTPIYDRLPGPSNTRVMKYPWRMLLSGSNQVVILNQEGGTNAIISGTNQTDFDMVAWDFAGTLTSLGKSLGTTNMGMARRSNGELLVVGSVARNDKKGESTLRTMATGFVESWLWQVPATLNPVGINGPRNLNLGANPPANPVGPAASVSMPTDVAFTESGGSLQYVIVPSFHTDRLVTLDATGGGTPDTWPASTTNLTPRTGAQGAYSLAGPRSVVVTTTGATTRVFVLCRLDASVRVFTLGAGGGLTQTAVIALPDPMPFAWRAGQRFLYDATLSGTNMVSCASCHVDGRTDRKAWQLDDPANPPPLPPLLTQTLPAFPGIAPSVRDGIAGTVPNPLQYPDDRGPMMTQTFQGLRTHPAEAWGADPHPLLSTRPFYWRGVRVSFDDFQPAFVNLMGMASGSEPTLAQMAAFRDFLFTIMYGPNAEQGPTRVFTGSLGNPNDFTSGSGALRGLKLFHTMPHDVSGPLSDPGGAAVAFGRSCVQCHALPHGSTNTITMTFGPQPIESAQIRAPRGRENELRLPGDFATTPGIGLFMADHGLFHDGTVSSVNTLVGSIFTPNGVNTSDIVQFVREFDTGIAPSACDAFSITAGNVAQWAGGLQVVAQVAIDQCERGHIGLAVERRVGTSTTNLFYDVRQQVFADPNNPGNPASFWTLNGTTPNGQLVPATLAANDVIVFQATPVGSERRIASASGTATVQTRSAPTVSSVTMVVSDPWKAVTGLSANLGLGFNWQGPAALFPKSIVAHQTLFTALSGTFGVPSAIRHEAPRRFRVTGGNIFQGARLTVFLPQTWSGTTVTSWTPLTFDLNPVRENGTLFWETSATIAPLHQYAMLCGWVNAPGVQSTLDTGSPGAQTLNPSAFNQYAFAVSNEHPTASPPPFGLLYAPLTIQ